MVSGVHRIVLFCNDTETSRDWYERAGFTYKRGYDGMHWFELGDGELLLHPGTPGAEDNRPTIHVAVPELDNTFERIRAADLRPVDHQQPGVTLEAPVQRPWGDREFELQDPDGQWWAFNQEPDRQEGVTQDVSASSLLEALDFLLEETFPGHPQPGNAFLDSGTSWWHTLDSISAEEASSAIVPGGTTIAGHLAHASFYLRIFREFDLGRTDPVDWDESWQVKQVDEEQWRALRKELDQEYQSVLSLIKERPGDWPTDRIGGAFGMVAHSAYHLGAIRQMVQVVRSRAVDD